MESHEAEPKAIRAAIRCRPITKQEQESQDISPLYCDSNANNVYVQRVDSADVHIKIFNFDSVLDEQSTTSQLYYEQIEDLVVDALDGTNAAVFTYGQTGTGKTFTMEGKHDSGAVQELGIIHFAAETIQEYILSQSQNQYCIKLANFQIKDEELFDLNEDGIENAKINAKDIVK